MQRCTLPVVPDVHVHALTLEEVDGQGLVSLGCYVHDCRAKLVSLVDVCISCVDQKLYDCEVAVVGGEVQCCEVFVSGLVCPC